MKIGVLGSIVEGKVYVDVNENDPFRDIFSTIQEAVAKGSLWDQYTLHVAEVQNRKVRPSSHVIKPTDTPNSLGLEPKGALVVLRAIGPVTSARESLNSASEPTVSNSRSYRDRMIAIYQKYEPSKVGTVDATLKKFKGKEEAVLRQLIKKYGPEPEGNSTSNSPRPQSAEAQQSKGKNTPSQASLISVSTEQTEVGYRDRLIAIYQKYEPAKVGTVDATLKKFKGKEEAVVRQLVKKYGPEPPASMKSTATTGFSPRSSLPSAREENAGTKSSSAIPVAREEKKEVSSKVKDDVKTSSRKENDSASSLRVQGNEPKARESAPITVNRDNSAAVDAEPSGKATPISKPHFEPYGFQKSYIAPTNHDLLEEPISETDAVSNDDECDRGDSMEASSPKPTKAAGIRTAPVTQNQEKIDTKNTPFQDTRQQGAHFVPERGAAEAVTSTATPAAHKLSEQTFSKLVAPRLARAVQKLAGSFSDVLDNNVRRTYWTKWLYGVAQQKALGLIGAKVWARAGGGARFVDDVPHEYVVEDFTNYVYERFIHTPRGLSVFSDTLQKALRELLYTAREHYNTLGTEERSGALSFGDEALCPVRDTKGVAAALREVTAMIRELAECKTQLDTQQKRLTQLDDERDEMRQELATAESFTGRFIAAQDELSETHTRLEQAEVRSHHAEDELRRMRYTVQNLQRELKRARGGERPQKEVVVQPKDAGVASLHQELARTRTRLRQEQKERKEVAKELDTVKHETSRLAQSLAEAKVRPVSSEPKSSMSGRAPSKIASVAEGSKLPRGVFSSQFTVEHVSDEEFLPFDSKDINSKTDNELLHENRILETHLEQPLGGEVDFGFCPHCVTQLTACTTERKGLSESKAAFCFSCRKSFTFKDISERDTHVRYMDRKVRGLARRGLLVSRK